MPNEPDMSAPVTRGEMHTALETWAGAIIDDVTTKLTAQFDAKFAAADAKFDGVGAIIHKLIAQSEAKFAAVDAKFDAVDAKFDSFMSEMRALSMTVERNILDRIDSLIEPYLGVPARVSALEEQALPERVSKLEAKVFAPKRRAKAARRTRS